MNPYPTQRRNSQGTFFQENLLLSFLLVKEYANAQKIIDELKNKHKAQKVRNKDLPPISLHQFKNKDGFDAIQLLILLPITKLEKENANALFKLLLKDKDFTYPKEKLLLNYVMAKNYEKAEKILAALIKKPSLNPLDLHKLKNNNNEDIILLLMLLPTTEQEKAKANALLTILLNSKHFTYSKETLLLTYIMTKQYNNAASLIKEFTSKERYIPYPLDTLKNEEGQDIILLLILLPATEDESKSAKIILEILCNYKCFSYPKERMLFNYIAAKQYSNANKEIKYFERQYETTKQPFSLLKLTNKNDQDVLQLLLLLPNTEQEDEAATALRRTLLELQYFSYPKEKMLLNYIMAKKYPNAKELVKFLKENEGPKKIIAPKEFKNNNGPDMMQLLILLPANEKEKEAANDLLVLLLNSEGFSYPIITIFLNAVSAKQYFIAETMIEILKRQYNSESMLDLEQIKNQVNQDIVQILISGVTDYYEKEAVNIILRILMNYPGFRYLATANNDLLKKAIANENYMRVELLFKYYLYSLIDLTPIIEQLAKSPPNLSSLAIKLLQILQKKHPDWKWLTSLIKIKKISPGKLNNFTSPEFKDVLKQLEIISDDSIDIEKLFMRDGLSPLLNLILQGNLELVKKLLHGGINLHLTIDAKGQKTKEVYKELSSKCTQHENTKDKKIISGLEYQTYKNMLQFLSKNKSTTTIKRIIYNPDTKTVASATLQTSSPLLDNPNSESNTKTAETKTSAFFKKNRTESSKVIPTQPDNISLLEEGRTASSISINTEYSSLPNDTLSNLLLDQEEAEKVEDALFDLEYK